MDLVILDILTELKARQPCMIDMDAVRPAMPGHTRCIIIDENERDEIVREIERLQALTAAIRP